LGRNLDPGKLSEARLLTSSGSERDANFREITWEPISSPATQCVSVIIEQPLQESKVAKFVTGVTLHSRDTETHIRIEMGRETAGIMRPATVEALRRPGLLRSLFSDRNLTLRRRGQLVEDRPVKIENDLSAHMLVEVVAELDRLPILVVDSGNTGAYKFAQQASRELGGLLRVALVRAFLVPQINAKLGEFNAQVPIRGATLVWPDARSVRRHPQYPAEDIDRGWSGADHRGGVNSCG
jgi:hypothetical protein